MSILKETPVYNFEKVKFRVRGRIIETTVFTPDHGNDPKLNLPPGGLHAHANKLNFQKPVWVPKKSGRHLK